MTSMRSTLACFAAATALLCAGCGGSAPKAVQSEPTPSPYLGMTVVGSTKAPDFALRDQSGRLVRMSARGGRVTLGLVGAGLVLRLIARRTSAP
jgi:hypothetical protein